MKIILSAGLLLVLTAVSMEAAPPAHPAHRANLDFEVLQSEIRPDPDDPGKKRLHLTLQYGGERLITGWQIGCVIGSSHGYAGSSATGIDGYRLMKGTSPRVDPWQDEALIAPGEVIEHSSGISIPQDGPYGVQICGMLAVVYEDLDAAGDPKIVNRIFRQRAVDVVAAEPALEVIDALLNEEALPPREVVHSRLDRIHDDPRTARIRDLVAIALANLQKADRSPEAILGDLRRDIAARRAQALEQFVPPNPKDPVEPPVEHDIQEPLLISLEDGKMELTSSSAGVRFDLDADGTAEQIAWTVAEGDDAFLVLDRDGNGTIDNGRELFGDVTPQLPSQEPNGFRALAVFDDPLNGGDGDGLLTAADSIWQHLELWLDANHDGISQADELQPLAGSGIDAIGLDYRTAMRSDRHGNLLRYFAPVSHSSVRGSRIAWDVFLTRVD